MSFGNQLRRVRKFRRMDQATLGKKIGLSERSAYSTISQYERGVKKPRKKETIYKLADALDVSPFMLEEPDVESGEKVIYILFWLAITYGLEIDELDGQPIFRFNQNKKYVAKNNVLQEQLQDWLAYSKKEKHGIFATVELYDWMFRYPWSSDCFISKELEQYSYSNMEEFVEAYYKALHDRYETSIIDEDHT